LKKEVRAMARPPARELTERELQVMHAFWGRGEGAAPATVAEVRDALAEAGLDLAYTTVATLVRILAEKGFLSQTNDERPFAYRPARTYEEVSRRLLGEVVDRVFRGSRELLLVRLMEQQRLSARERELLREALAEAEGDGTDGHGGGQSKENRGKPGRGRRAP
jgi:predicted transcriptional regulator